MVYKNKCPCCDVERIYKTKQGWLKANRLNSLCNSCSNSVQAGGKGNVKPVNGLKVCFICKEELPIDKFHIVRGKIHSRCKACNSIRHKEYYKSTFRFTRRGIDLVEYTEKMNKQHSKCPICNIELTDPCIDHCHKTGKVRGILCRTCNLALGQFKDSREVLENAIKYLSDWT